MAGLPAEASNPEDYYEFVVAIPDGPQIVDVQASVGDGEHPTWRRVSFEGVPAGVVRAGRERVRLDPHEANVDNFEVVRRFHDRVLHIDLKRRPRARQPRGGRLWQL